MRTVEAGKSSHGCFPRSRRSATAPPVHSADPGTKPASPTVLVPELNPKLQWLAPVFLNHLEG
jgi:hypothetical protein